MSNLRTLVIASACWSRNVGAATSKTAARYSGEKSSRNFRSMLTKTRIAAVVRPDFVDMGRCRAMPCEARKMNDRVRMGRRRPYAAARPVYVFTTDSGGVVLETRV